MTWKTGFGPASFRGVAFFVRSNERSGGRRLAVHEYPFQDAPYAEDIGRKRRGFSVEGYVVGEDYTTDRDDLLDALEQDGPGPLVHPYWGSRTVAVDDFRVRESTDEGGMAVFSIQFIETPAQPAQPAAVPDATGKLTASTSTFQTAVKTEFLATYNPNRFTAPLAGALNAAATVMGEASSAVQMDPQIQAQLGAAVLNLQDNAAGLVAQPSNLWDSVYATVVLLPLKALSTLYYFLPGTAPPLTTPDEITANGNFLSLQWMIQRLALLQAATLLPSATFTSYEDAVNQRNAITALLDDQAQNAADTTFPALVDLRSSLVMAVPGPGSDLPNLVTYTPPDTVCSLVLAHRLYGSVAREQDLLTRNDVQNPCFVQGGVSLEVLSD